MGPGQNSEYDLGMLLWDVTWSLSFKLQEGNKNVLLCWFVGKSTGLWVSEDHST